MKQREKNLAIIMGVVALGLGGYYMIWPKVILPFIELPKRIEAKQAELEKIKAEAAGVEKDLASYAEYVSRSGGTDADKVKDDFNARLGLLMQECGLRNQKVTPKKPIEDRKTQISTVSYSISGEGNWASMIDFVKQFYAMPQVSQLTNLKLSPGGSSSRDRNYDVVKLIGKIGRAHV